MIPTDVAARLQISADAVLRPVAPTQVISDKLSDLVAGQRILAEIQALMPNGTYRAVINQRSITLALPFLAKSGDSLELVVTESNGKRALAVLAHRDSQGAVATPANTSASATLSRVGQLISDLLGGNREPRSQALPLNNHQPIANQPPVKGMDILPLLRQAIMRSGMFYESHLAQWLEGRLPKSSLLQEPQGRLPPLPNPNQPSTTANSAQTPPAQSTPANSAQPGSVRGDESARTTIQMTAEQSARAEPGATQARPNVVFVPENTATARTAAESAQTQSQIQSQAQTPVQMIAPQAQSIVQQQLLSLSTQNFVWQGEAWPGQTLRWEIEDQTDRQARDDEEVAEKWQTGLQMTLPKLGGIDARISLTGDQISITITAKTVHIKELMQLESEALRRQMSEAGLLLTSVGFATDISDELEAIHIGDGMEVAHDH